MIMMVNFSPINIVQVLPFGQFRSVPDGNAMFTCVSHGHPAVGMQWLINDRLFENQNLENVTEEFLDFSNGLVGVLNFTNLPVNYNRTRIQCKANVTLPTGKTITLSSENNVTLLIFPSKFMPI